MRPRVLMTAVALLGLAFAGDIEQARRDFPPDVTRDVLAGRVKSPEGFDAAAEKEMGAERLKELRGGADASGRENDAAAQILAKLGVKPGSIARGGGRGPDAGSGEVTVVRTGVSYRAASAKQTSGAFRTGQEADLLLSGFGFDTSGGAGVFNHPMGIASDGTRLFVADTYNNRILGWSKLPASNVPPDFVLGQPAFDTNDPGTARDRLNFPLSLSCGGGKLVATDTENNRILVWSKIPTKSGTPADLVLQGGEAGGGLRSGKDRFIWPWGVWTDGTKLAVASTKGGWVLLWNAFPQRDNQPADVILTGGGKLGTPRHITSDGKCLIVGDHNPKLGGEGQEAATFVWTSWPAKDETPYDFVLKDPSTRSGPWLRGNFTADGRLVLLGGALSVYDGLPAGADTRPLVSVTGWNIRGGDHVASVSAGGRLYVCTGNWNKVVVYNALPAKAGQKPDFVLGAPDLDTDTLQTNFIISNPVPVSDGTSLFVSSDFDRKLYVWKRIPADSGAAPDLVYSLPDGPWDNALCGGVLALAGQRRVMIWKKPPLDGEKPDVVLAGGAGEVRFQDLRGVAMDARYFYLADAQARKVWVWKGIPEGTAAPVATLDVDMQVGRLACDGTWLTACPITGPTALVWRVDEIEKGGKPRVLGSSRPGTRFNLLQGAEVAQGKLFAVECGGARVFCWTKIEDALDGKPADAVLGREVGKEDAPPSGIGKARFHWPSAACYDGNRLWVGETKFSERLLRFSPE